MPISKGDHLRRIFYFKDVTYIFLFMDESLGRDARRSCLEQLCYIARGMREEREKGVSEVIGIASERKMSPTCSYDFFYYKQPNWTDKLQADFVTRQKALGIFENPIYAYTQEDEYPKQ